MTTTIEMGNAAEARAVQPARAEGLSDRRAKLPVSERRARCGRARRRRARVRRGAQPRRCWHGHAAETFSTAKQRQVARVAKHYIGRRDPVFGMSRFDVVAITGDDAVPIRDALRL